VLFLPNSYSLEGELRFTAKALSILRGFIAVNIISPALGTGDNLTHIIFFAFLHHPFSLLSVEFGKKEVGTLKVSDHLFSFNPVACGSAHPKPRYL